MCSRVLFHDVQPSLGCSGGTNLGTDIARHFLGRLNVFYVFIF